METNRRSRTSRRPIHGSRVQGEAGEGIIYLNDDIETVKLDKKREPCKVGSATEEYFWISIKVKAQVFTTKNGEPYHLSTGLYPTGVTPPADDRGASPGQPATPVPGFGEYKDGDGRSVSPTQT